MIQHSTPAVREGKRSQGGPTFTHSSRQSAPDMLVHTAPRMEAKIYPAFDPKLPRLRQKQPARPYTVRNPTAPPRTAPTNKKHKNTKPNTRSLPQQQPRQSVGLGSLMGSPWQAETDGERVGMVLEPDVWQPNIPTELQTFNAFNALANNPFEGTMESTMDSFSDEPEDEDRASSMCDKTASEHGIDTEDKPQQEANNSLQTSTNASEPLSEEETTRCEEKAQQEPASTNAAQPPASPTTAESEEGSEKENESVHTTEDSQPIQQRDNESEQSSSSQDLCCGLTPCICTTNKKAKTEDDNTCTTQPHNDTSSTHQPPQPQQPQSQQRPQQQQSCQQQQHTGIPTECGDDGHTQQQHNRQQGQQPEMLLQEVVGTRVDSVTQQQGQQQQQNGQLHHDQLHDGVGHVSTEQGNSDDSRTYNQVQQQQDVDTVLSTDHLRALLAFSSAHQQKGEMIRLMRELANSKQVERNTAEAHEEAMNILSNVKPSKSCRPPKHIIHTTYHSSDAHKKDMWRSYANKPRSGQPTTTTTTTTSSAEEEPVDTHREPKHITTTTTTPKMGDSQLPHSEGGEHYHANRDHRPNPTEHHTLYLKDYDVNIPSPPLCKPHVDPEHNTHNSSPNRQRAHVNIKYPPHTCLLNNDPHFGHKSPQRKHNKKDKEQHVSTYTCAHCLSHHHPHHPHRRKNGMPPTHHHSHAHANTPTAGRKSQGQSEKTTEEAQYAVIKKCVMEIFKCVQATKKQQPATQKVHTPSLTASTLTRDSNPRSTTVSHHHTPSSTKVTATATPNADHHTRKSNQLPDVLHSSDTFSAHAQSSGTIAYKQASQKMPFHAIWLDSSKTEQHESGTQTSPKSDSSRKLSSPPQRKSDTHEQLDADAKNNTTKSGHGGESGSIHDTLVHPKPTSTRAALTHNAMASPISSQGGRNRLDPEYCEEVDILTQQYPQNDVDNVPRVSNLPLRAADEAEQQEERLLQLAPNVSQCSSSSDHCSVVGVTTTTTTTTPVKPVSTSHILQREKEEYDDGNGTVWTRAHQRTVVVSSSPSVHSDSYKSTTPASTTSSWLDDRQQPSEVTFKLLKWVLHSVRTQRQQHQTVKNLIVTILGNLGVDTDTRASEEEDENLVTNDEKCNNSGVVSCLPSPTRLQHCDTTAIAESEEEAMVLEEVLRNLGSSALTTGKN